MTWKAENKCTKKWLFCVSHGAPWGSSPDPASSHCTRSCRWSTASPLCSGLASTAMRCSHWTSSHYDVLVPHWSPPAAGKCFLWMYNIIEKASALGAHEPFKSILYSGRGRQQLWQKNSTGKMLVVSSLEILEHRKLPSSTPHLLMRNKSQRDKGMSRAILWCVV